MANQMLSAMRAKTLYLGLLRAVPDKTGNGGNEVSASSYVRQGIAFAVPDNSAMSNSARADFPTALTDWGTIEAYAIFDAQSGGSMLWYGVLEQTVSAPVGSLVFVPLNGLTVSVGLS